MKPQSPLNEPQQKRSQESLERLLMASQNLISTGNFDEASIQDITQLADYSVGAFYSRFRNKDALFQVIQVRVLADLGDWTKEQLSAFKKKSRAPGNQPSLQACVDFCVSLIFRMLSRNPGVYRAIFLHTRLKRDPELLRKVQNFNTRRVEDSIEILKLAKDIDIDPEMIARWKAGIGLVSAYIREIVLFGDPLPSNKKPVPESMVRAARDMFLAYLTTSTKDE